MHHETSLPDTLSQKNKKERKRTIPTGTKVKVLAISFDRKFDLSHEEWFTASVPCVIELADSTRLLCPLPEIIISRRLALKDNKKDSVTIEKIGGKGKEKKLVLYGRTSQNELKEYSYKELDMKILPKLPMTETFAGKYLSLNYLKKELTGKSFQEVEQILKPAQSVIKTGNDRIACYQHIGTTSSHESSFYRHIQMEAIHDYCRKRLLHLPTLQLLQSISIGGQAGKRNRKRHSSHTILRLPRIPAVMDQSVGILLHKAVA